MWLQCKFRVNANSIAQHLIQKWNNDKCQCECKKYRGSKKDYRWNPSTSICENNRYLESAVDDSVIVCNEIISVTSSLSINMANTLSTNVTSIVSVNSNDKKKDINWNVTFCTRFLINHITIYICHYLLSLWKTLLW